MTQCDSCGAPAGCTTTTVEVDGKLPTLYFCSANKCNSLTKEALHALAVRHRDRQRYAQQRKLVKWDSPKLKVLKMLAHVIVKHERATKDRLWEQAKALYPEVMAVVLPFDGRSFDGLCQVVLEKFGVPLTPEKLMQRADKTARNHEFNEYLAAVEEAYLQITKRAA
jgi:hypothetical protein